MDSLQRLIRLRGHLLSLTSYLGPQRLRAKVFGATLLEWIRDYFPGERERERKEKWLSEETLVSQFAFMLW